MFCRCIFIKSIDVTCGTLDYGDDRIYIAYMRPLVVSQQILQKLQEKHSVNVREIEQCFENKVGEYLEDTDPAHQTEPPTLWFVAPTNCGRMLKVIFVYLDGNFYIKSAYEANEKSITYYDQNGK